MSVLLFAALLTILAVPAGTAQSQQREARFYNVYGDHMLFQQNEDAIFAGTASPGAAISVALKNAGGETVRTAACTAKSDGTFSVSFPAPAGSFETYCVVLSENGSAVCTLTDVVFGELWLSFGQSNMEYQLFGTPEGRQMQAEGKTGRHDIRVLWIPHKVKDGAFFADGTPQAEVPDCFWFGADSDAVFSMSAIAYFFAEKMLDELDMPVGILNAAVGGSGIIAWLPRAAAEADADVLSALKAHNAYVSSEDWNTGTRNYLGDLSGIFNSKVAPLLNFRPAGGLWYQGETDLMLYNDPAFYHQLFSLMQDSYTALFSRSAGRLPLIFSQLAVYNYGLGPYGETKFNDVFTALAAEDPESRSEIVIHDILPAYDSDNHPIHPHDKKPVGERMAGCAVSLVYDGAAPASSPYMTGMQARDGSVFVEFGNVGDGLVCSGDSLRGFSVYGEDGVCVGAQAEIVSNNTVRVFSEAVPAPKGAAYAVNSVSLGANLFSSFAGERCLPAASFGSSDPEIVKLFDDAEWLYCDSLSAWQCSGSTAGFEETWTGKNASLSVSDDRVQGQASLEIRGTGRRFSASAVLCEKSVLKKTPYDNYDTDFSAYGALSLRLKNTGETDVTLQSVRLYGKTELFFCPVCAESEKISAVIPADGLWHTYSFDLNRLGLLGGAVDRWSNDALGEVTEVRLCFSGKDASVLCDDLRFSPEGADDGAEGSLLQRVIAFFLGLLEQIKSAFAGGLNR